MSDISASERRLSAALDRLDQLLDIPSTIAPQGEDSSMIGVLTGQLETAQARIQELQQATPAPRPVQDDALRQQLDVATGRNAELSAANDELAAANRNLIEAQDTGGIGADEIRDALEAEVKALRAARQAEIAQMGEIMAELERLLSNDTATETAPSTEGL
ncbi:hypothetical protein [Paracoccus sp. JM45]|uniref:hypothetical protein n=1 Tax=Paracoccus sp. JM45 TaxID=2283626 RepID=UPI000E6BCB87|nr:hypothetical protein [Paracoccus sp. JM45]RJE81618.1 hypothetical protein DWB67_03045 [Paracoccus sp. JM45]